MAQTRRTAGQTANKLSFIDAYNPKENSYVLTDCGVCKVDRNLVFTNPDGELIINRILAMSCGVRMEEDESTEVLFATHFAENIVNADDVDYYRSFYNDEFSVEEVAEEIVGELLAWGIDTVQKEDGSQVSLKDYVNETILKK